MQATRSHILKLVVLSALPATLLLTAGTTKILAVRQDVDLSKRSVGKEVVFRCTDAVALSVEKP